jgi:hypothetical protein
MHAHSTTLALALSLLLAACGGGAPSPAAEPEAPGKPAEPAPKAEAEVEPKPDEPAPPDPGPRPSRSPIETIAAPKIAFVINHQSSEPMEKADQKCEAASKGDPRAKALCLQKEKGDFMADIVRFRKSKDDKYSWIIYRRKGSTLTVLSKSDIEFSDETPNSVTISVLGKDKSPRVLFTHKNKFKVSVPNDYSIELDDPRFGKLIYDAKIDLFDEEQ